MLRKNRLDVAEARSRANREDEVHRLVVEHAVQALGRDGEVDTLRHIAKPKGSTAADRSDSKRSVGRFGQNVGDVLGILRCDNPLGRDAVDGWGVEMQSVCGSKMR